ncbi:MAG: hypothetical protein HC838_08890 [Spirulinaceae cyanobacterium RM2_2_10]|nr:hypothetical protein [Spirulinaceae cyanobacterium SM2_1_0]NJO20139.1 hypothetical protein [Spirulinaceae cyanobacterium RM2_2_10]
MTLWLPILLAPDPTLSNLTTQVINPTPGQITCAQADGQTLNRWLANAEDTLPLTGAG